MLLILASIFVSNKKHIFIFHICFQGEKGEKGIYEYTEMAKKGIQGDIGTFGVHGKKFIK